jgi:hypothetical protein
MKTDDAAAVATTIAVLAAMRVTISLLLIPAFTSPQGAQRPGGPMVAAFVL